MKHFLKIAALLTLFAFPVSEADAACAGGTCFWRNGVTANWSNTTAVTGPWSIISSAGAACACAPASSADNVVFDAGSGSPVSTIDTPVTIGTFIATNYTGSLTYSAALTVAGDTFTFGSGMTVTATNRATIFTPASGHTVTVTSAGKTFGAITLTGADGTATLTPADAVSITNNTNGVLTVNGGTFDASVNNVALSMYYFNSPNGSTRTVNMGSNTWTITGDDAAVTAFGIGTTATLNAGTSTLLFNKTTPVATVTLSTGGEDVQHRHV